MEQSVDAVLRHYAVLNIIIVCGVQQPRPQHRGGGAWPVPLHRLPQGEAAAAAAAGGQSEPF